MAKRRQLTEASNPRSKRKKSTAKGSAPTNLPKTSSIGATTAHAVLPVSRVSNFFNKFPAEIRIQIYELAYPEGQLLKIKPTYPVRARNCALNHLLVSKQWFNETIEIFARATEFEFSDFRAMEEIVQGLPGYLASGISRVSVHSLDGSPGLRWPTFDSGPCEQRMRKLSERTPKLEYLRLHLPRGFCWLEDNTSEDLGVELAWSYSEITGICTWRGLKDFKVEIGPGGNSTDSAQLDALQVEKYVKSRVCQSRGDQD
ncbi:uncharacterized protein RCC_07395 [Ramularia collo-cygni]|uniref:Uncharacterized protein n=1 Tax=Ramularia collo-cygni TaxID=112498 RepID=A0A2D3UV29_9PEZI|nr:uncharacterized protein RCC_07395 [Ramularia collo-cygni]CZT21532.1 uncharacterized protein RCC_07395 [Ramularia collo-cygni]